MTLANSLPAKTSEDFMPKYKVGDRVQVKLSGGRLVEATVKAMRETTDGVRLQVTFGDETALIYLWQIVQEE
jgi:hypothetical protein